LNEQSAFGEVVTIEELEDRSAPGFIGVIHSGLHHIREQVTTIVWDEL
jgi:hypothetical protein